MPVNITGLRIFFASPAGLGPERELFWEVVDDFNQKRAIGMKFLFIPVMSELLTGGQGRAQSRINAKLEECDFCIVMFYNQYGSCPGGDERYKSGTEEEYDKAVGCMNDSTKFMKEVVPFFKRVSEGEAASPGPELVKVLKFKERISGSCQYIEFSNEADLRQELEKHFGQWLKEKSSPGLPERPGRDVLDYEPEPRP